MEKDPTERALRQGPSKRERNQSTNCSKTSDASTSSSSTTSGKQEQIPKDLRAALQELVTTNQLELLQEDVHTVLQSDQKSINHKRKLAGRIERLRKAQSKKQEQWEVFQKEMKEHYQTELSRYEKEMNEIKIALGETQLNLDKEMKGIITEEPEEITIDEDNEFDQWIKSQAKPKDKTKNQETEGKSEDMDQALNMTQENQKMLAQQLHEMQAQMSYVVQALRTPIAVSPGRNVPQSPSVGAMTPEQAKGPHRRSAVEPFKISSGFLD